MILRTVVLNEHLVWNIWFKNSGFQMASYRCYYLTELGRGMSIPIPYKVETVVIAMFQNL